MVNVIEFLTKHKSFFYALVFIFFLALVAFLFAKYETYESQTPYYSADSEQGSNDIFAQNNYAAISEPSDLNVDMSAHDHSSDSDNDLLNNLEMVDNDQENDTLEAFNASDNFEHFSNEPHDFIVLK